MFKRLEVGLGLTTWAVGLTTESLNHNEFLVLQSFSALVVELARISYTTPETLIEVVRANRVKSVFHQKETFLGKLRPVF